MGSLYSVDAATGNITTAGSITSTSISSGFLLPRLTTTQRNAIVSPATGLEIFNLTTNQIEFYNGTVWGAVGGGSGSGTVSSGSVGRLSIYTTNPTGTTVGDTLISGGFSSTVTLGSPGQSTNWSFVDPGTSTAYIWSAILSSPLHNSVVTTDNLGRMTTTNTINSSISLNNNKITSLGTPTASTDASNKLYVDANSGPSSLLRSNGGFESWPIATSYTINAATISFQNGWFANYTPGGQTNHTASRSTGAVDTGVYNLDMFGGPTGTANWYVYYPVSNYQDYAGKTLSWSARVRVDAGSAGIPSLFAGFYDGVNTNVATVTSSASYQTLSGTATVAASPTQLWFVVGFAPSGFTGLSSAYLFANGHVFVDSCKLVTGSTVPVYTPQDNRGAVQQSATTGVAPTVGIGGGTLIGTVTIAATGTPIKVTGMVNWVNTATSGSSGNEIWLRNVTRGDTTALNGSYVNPGITNGLTAGSINQAVTTVETYDCPNAGNTVYEFRMASTAGSATSVNRFSLTAREEDL